MSGLASGAVAVVLAYLIGAIPFGYLIARRVAGTDIRTLGSGNIGATNVSRIVGGQWGALVLLMDCLKGLLPTWWFPLVAVGADTTLFPHVRVACGVAAVLGHVFPCWLSFRGGKGVATSLGVVSILSPWATAASTTAFLIVFILTRFVALGSIVAAVVFAAVQLMLLWPEPFAPQNRSLAIFSLLIQLLIVLRHRSNIVRLLRGEEDRMGSATSPDDSP